LGGGLTTLPRKTQYLLRITTHSLGTEAGCCECGDELQPVMKCAAYSSEPVPVLSDKQNISTGQSAYQIYILPYTHISFKINMFFIQSTGVPPEDQWRPPRGATYSLRTSDSETWCIHKQNTCSFWNIAFHGNRFLLFMKHVAVWVMTDAEHSQHNNKLTGKTFRVEACLSEGGGYFQHLR
jgi:hypothetical protein